MERLRFDNKLMTSKMSDLKTLQKSNNQLKKDLKMMNVKYYDKLKENKIQKESILKQSTSLLTQMAIKRKVDDIVGDDLPQKGSPNNCSYATDSSDVDLDPQRKDWKNHLKELAVNQEWLDKTTDMNEISQTKEFKMPSTKRAQKENVWQK